MLKKQEHSGKVHRTAVWDSCAIPERNIPKHSLAKDVFTSVGARPGSSVGCENSDGDSKADSTTREGAEGDQRGAARDPKMVWTEIGNW